MLILRSKLISVHTCIKRRGLEVASGTPVNTKQKQLCRQYQQYKLSPNMTPAIKYLASLEGGALTDRASHDALVSPGLTPTSPAYLAP